MSDMKQQSLSKRKMKAAHEEDQGDSKVTKQKVNMKQGKKNQSIKSALLSIVRINSLIMGLFQELKDHTIKKNQIRNV